MDYDIIIIGAGLAGAATAYHLRARSRQQGTSPPRVLVLEQEATAGEHSSGRNAALVRGHLEDAVMAPLAERGAAGVRLYPDASLSGGGPPGLWKAAGELGLVVSCMGKADQFASEGFRDVVDACPGTTVVIEHLAGAGHAEAPYEAYRAALELAERPNTFIKVPGLGEITPRPPRLGPEFHFDDVPPLFEMARDAFGPQRMMWGSDFPPSAGREGYRNVLNGVREHPAFADGDDLEWVLGRTAAAVWGFAS